MTTAGSGLGASVEASGGGILLTASDEARLSGFSAGFFADGFVASSSSGFFADLVTGAFAALAASGFFAAGFFVADFFTAD